MLATLLPITTLVRLVQSSNVSFGRLVTPLPSVALASLESYGGISGQHANATRDNRTAGQPVRLPHTKERLT